MLRALKFIGLFRELFGNAKSFDAKKIEQRGLLAVKIAQMYAVRSDLLGVEKSQKLQHLFEQATPISWEAFEEQIQQNASEEFHKRVRKIEKKPLATASLGQVHEGVLDDGTKVIIKVVKPKAAQYFQKDLAAVKALAKCGVFFYPKLKRLADPVGTLDTIGRLTETELDLRNEYKGTARLLELRDMAEDLTHLGSLSFPEIYQDLTTSRVCVAEKLEEQSVAKGLEAGSFSYDQLLNLFRVQGYFLFYRGEFHGDLHPGNIFFKGEKLWVIDNANVEKADSTFTMGLLKFLGKLGNREFRAAGQVMESLSLSPLKDNEAFLQKFEKLYAGFESGHSSLTNQMMETVKLCVHSGLEFPEGAFPVIKSLMYLDGMALKCAPEARLLDDVLKYTSDFDGA